MKYIEINAVAKINLGLNVVSKRDDGYHNLETVFYPLFDLHDKVFIKKSDKFSFFCENDEINRNNNNLFLTPINKLEILFKRKFNVEINCLKNIPIGAGLGGGSSDAASIIISLNDMFGLGLGTEEMIKLALEIGSDVPFFIKAKPSYATGRGEILEQLHFYLNYPILLINPNIHVSTKEAFSNINPQKSEFDIRTLFLKDEPDFLQWRQYLKNDFEKTVFKQFPLLKNIKEELYKYGAEFSLMSGSGATVYGIFKDISTAEKAKNNFPNSFFKFLNLP
ncbi:MAG TPA: 4-(cytidine 5'-diphospho)-2-C-methyl-D-erythritol kinase [Melioribacteraceae bacterium]|nr:4-(cytidine 5'-diphospho)-2-C-methyl-D-erythritol kinase [Melioribacteraceae bacterium]